MKCIITYTESTKDEDFYAEGADAVVPDLAHVCHSSYTLHPSPFTLHPTPYTLNEEKVGT